MVSKAKKKGLKKKFYEVSVPMTSTKVQLYATSEEELVGRTVKLDMTKNLRGKNLELKFKVVEEKGRLVGKPVSTWLIQSYVKRVMRRGSDYVEDSFETECRDAIVRIKPFLITRKKVSRAVRRALRENAKKNIISYVKTRTAEELVSDIMVNKLQKQLIPKLKKIYPLALCEIRVFEIGKKLDGKKKVEKEVVEKEE